MDIKVQGTAYGWVITRNGSPVEFTRKYSIKHYRTQQAAEKAAQNLRAKQ